MRPSRIALCVVSLFALWAMPGLSENSDFRSRSGHSSNSPNGNYLPIAIFIHSDYVGENTNSISQQSNQHTVESPHAWMVEPEWMIVWVTGLYTFVSSIALILLGVQIRHAKISTQRQLRAYVVPEFGVITNVANVPAIEGLEPNAKVVNPDIGPHATVDIRNVGQTPTYDVRHSQSIYIRAFPTHPSQLPKIDANTMPSILILGPNIPGHEKVFLPHRLTELEVENLRQGLAAIFVIGVIEYTDIFGKSHVTNYKMIHHSNGGKIGFGTHLLAYEDGNNGN
jgi:hypothetical protein